MLAWGQFVALVKGLLSTAALEHLRQAYQKRTILVASLLTTESGLTQENKTITDQRAIARYDYDKDSCPS
ncbi:MAG: hypothetical protein RID53_24985 [Coleofasciculus sp. B1-GNL1-01]|uniref:hypothetical protein n=1 Tax=Coleofasciculus sp. B1-GNL1-01 TaxID=3068484 RepID=UPI0032F4B9D7